MPRQDLAFSGLDAVAADIRAGRTSAAEVVDACLAQVEKFAESHHVLTRVHGDEARARADQLDAEASRGLFRGPLHGVPFIVKDLFDVAGYPNSGGTGMRRDAEPAGSNAPSVQAMLDAGAILIAQANLHEWAYGGTSTNPFFGPTTNAWGENLIPGGSSGGSAVAVSVGMSHVALGTDTGGSVRIPASLSGISSLKVTVGGISTEGVLPLSWTLDSVGPMARKVADLRVPYLAMLATGGQPLPQQPRRHRHLAGTRVGIDRSYYLEQGRMDPGVYTGFSRALEELESVGVEVVDVSIPALKQASPAQYALVLAESAAVHSGPWRENRPQYGEDVQGYVALGDVLPAQDYIAALRFRSVLWQQFKEAFAEVDFLISPGTPHLASPIGQGEFTWPDGSVESLLDACWRFTFPSNLAGIPSVSLPCGLSPEGLPVGFQLIGEPLSELALLDFGTQLENAFDDWGPTPPIVDRA